MELSNATSALPKQDAEQKAKKTCSGTCEKCRAKKVAAKFPILPAVVMRQDSEKN